MQILSDFSKDTQTPGKPSGSYEWWYFDILTADGYSVVIIFYDGNPFSRRYISAMESDETAGPESFPAISVSVYKKGKPLFYLFDECLPAESNFSKETPKGHVKRNSFAGIKTETGFKYDVNLDQTLSSGDRIDASLSFHCANWDPSGMVKGSTEKEKHIWNLVGARCEVSGEVYISGYKKYQVAISGTGYHDHNVGFEPMKDSFTEWYWGRYHLPQSTLVYYLMNERNTWTNKAWLIGNNGEIRALQTRADKSDKQRNLFGLHSFRAFTFFDKTVELYLQKDRVTDDGPFYQRFEGRLISNSGENIEECRGISEYIYPSRIYKKIFWPLVNMRIAYPEKAHWVQKNPRLYRWTW
jgi:carotenoid 1,2-hydratase